MSWNESGGSGKRGFGRLLKGSLSRSRPEDVPLTEHIKDLCKGLNLSARTIWRLMESETWPNTQTLEELSKVLPEFEWATSNSDSLRGCWKTAWIDQQKLPERSTITIFSAAEDPKALHDRGIAESVARNVLVKGCRYVFLCPPHPQPEIPRLRVGLAGALLMTIDKLSKVLPQKLQAKLDAPDSLLQSLLDNIYIFRTQETAASWKMWGGAPRYAVLYNILSPDTEAFKKYGMYWTKGVSIYSSPTSEAPEVVQGWEFLEASESNKLIYYIESKDNGVIAAQDLKKWPIPGA